MTYFEILTALAYQYFLVKVDFAIMEIGLGGEWDAVNVADAEIAILTTLGLDHTEYLGNSLDEIAKTKAKIVREETTVITGWEKNYHKHIPRCKNIFHAKTIGDWIKTYRMLRLINQANYRCDSWKTRNLPEFYT